jgi:protein-L-isoaspartate(D-aspartate) O-methyltransferase
MTELLRSGRELGRVLEVGTGCGYQTAVLAQVSKEVYSVERIGSLLSKAKRVLQQLRATNVRLKHADGTQLLPEGLTFDGILVTAAASHIPATLVAQLETGGRLVLPVTQSESGVQTQRLKLIEKTATGARETTLEEVRFVPLLSGKQ